MGKIVQQTTKRSYQGVADIVFVIDASPSMNSIIDALINNIENFIENLKTEKNFESLDLRFGLLYYNWKEFYKLDFTDDLSTLVNAIKNRPKSKYEEYTLPAIDYALDFDWRIATRIIIVFTDERLQDNHNPEFQNIHFKKLINKIVLLKVHLYLIALECPEYQNLIKYTPKANGKFAKNKRIFMQYDFQDIIGTMGKTLSATLLQLSNIENTMKDIYNVQKEIKLITL